MYLHENVLFVCDIVLVHDDRKRVTPYGMGKRSLTAAVERILETTSGRDLELVCGWNAVTPFSRWRPSLERAHRDLQSGAGEDDSP